jgi:glucosamine kinase
MRTESLICGVGIDAGGTSTRWAVMDSSGALRGSGSVAGLSGVMLMTDLGRVTLDLLLSNIAAQVLALAAGAPLALYAGVTGLDDDTTEFDTLLSARFATDQSRISTVSDVELAYHAAFADDSGFLVYAGTGSIAAHIDRDRRMHRVGGHGGHLDDGGSGYWIVRQALRSIWRTEDERPGAWRHSALACAVFARIGGETWSETRSFFYGKSRGEIGQLALAVSESADADTGAMQILVDAGGELARLAKVLAGRFGEHPIKVAGRAAQLHPAILASMRSDLPADVTINLAPGEPPAHHAAALLALGLHSRP